MSDSPDVGGTSISGVWFRHVPESGDPLYEPPDPADGRWQHGSVIPALYLANAEVTMWAEWYRGLAAAHLTPDQGMPRDVWRWEVSLPDVADLSDDDKLARIGLRPTEPDRGQWRDYQGVGEQLYEDGRQAILFPSAAHTGGQNLCVFRQGHQVPGLEPIPPPDTVTTAPAVPKGLRT